MIKNITIVIIIFSVYLIGFGYCQSFKDVSPLGTRYKSYFSDGQCSFNDFYMLCNQYPCIFSFEPNDMVDAKIVNSNSTSTLYKLTIANYKTVGTQVIQFNGTELFKLECIVFDISRSELEKVTNYFQHPDISTSSIYYSIVYRIIGTNIDYSIIDTFNWNNWSSSKCSTVLNCGFYMGSYGYMVFQFPFKSNLLDISSLTQPIDFTIQGRIFYIEPFLNGNGYMNISNVKTYPSIQYLNNYQTQGYGEGAVVEFTTNTTVFDNRAIFVISSEVSPVSIPYHPIKGNSQSTTFLFPMLHFNSYNLYYQNGLNFNLSSSMPVNIKEYIIGSLDSQWDLEINHDLVKTTASTFFKLDSVYKFTPIKTEIGIGDYSFKFNLKFPFGFVQNFQNGSLLYNVTYLVKDCSKLNMINFKLSFPTDLSLKTLTLPTSFDYDINKPLQINKVEYKYLFYDYYLMDVYVTTGYSFGSIKTGNSISGIESKLKGMEIYQVLISTSRSPDIILYDTYGNSIQYFKDDLLAGLSDNIVQFLNYPKKLDSSFDPYSIKDISFLYSSVNVTDHRHYNVLYFNYTDGVPRDTPVLLVIADVSFISNLEQLETIEDRTFYGSYNYSKKLFQIEFYIDANTQDGPFSMGLVIGDNVIHDRSFKEKLTIKSSSMDLLGPLITKVKKSQELTLSDYQLSQTGEITWTMTIEDTINGFDWGYIVIRGDLDQSIYNLTFNSANATKGDRFIGEYRFSIKAYYPCVSQNFVISQVVLYDRVKRMSIYSTFLNNKLYSGVMNPFLNLLDDPTIYSIPLTCEKSRPVAANDITPPILTLFNASVDSVDIYSLQTVTFTFIAIDPESGIKVGQQNPVVYLSSISNHNILECISNIVAISNVDVYGKIITYSCSIEIPLGFGYIDGILVSVYGFINNNGYISGYSSTDLSKVSKNYFISTTFNENSAPRFTSYYRISEKGGDLWLMGRGFENTITLVTVEYYDGSKQSINVDNVHHTILRVPGILPTSKPFKVSASITNSIIVTPIVYDYYLNPTESSSSSSTDIPLPTNKPQSCPGNPVCGGPSNGICVTNQGCVCLSGRVGLDCSSEIIIIDQPKINDTSPSTNITLPVSDGSSSTTVTYKSLITLVSIRELDVSGKPIFSKSFEKWQVTALQSDNTTLIYNTTLEINKNNQISTTSFKVTLNWFTKQSNITFANEQLIMNPSTMKYTIEIGNYPFDSALNHLQLVMSASIESDSKDNSVCSVREFGETTSGDNSNYLKIQVDNHSLYGRFIRRGILDSTIRSITNVLLDKDMNSITTTKQLQSFIGIEIPHFNDNAIIDPDFSVLIDSKSASSKSNSICSKSKLSGAKIAGIVIGCVAFVAVITVAITYHIIKKKKDAKFISNVNQKMKQMNNDKL